MEMMYGASPGSSQGPQSSYPLPYQGQQQTGFLQSYPHRGSSSSDTSGQTPKPVNIEQYLAYTSQEPSGRVPRQSRAERPSSTYDHKTIPASAPPFEYYGQPQVYQQQRYEKHDIQPPRATPEHLYRRKYGSQDESYRQPPQTYQRGSWDGSKPSEVDERAKKARWGRDRSLDTVSKKRGKNLSASSTDSYQYPSSSVPWDGSNRLSRDSSMESVKSDSSKVVKASTANVLAYTPRRAKPFVCGRATTVDISMLDRGSQGSLSSIGDVSQPIQENREASFVAPWRLKDRPSSQVFEPLENKEAVKRQPLVKSGSLDKPLPSLRTTHCDSPDLDELVEANIEAATDSPRTARKAKREKRKDLSSRINDNRLSERSKTRPEYYGEELSYCPAVTFQPAFEKHVAQVTQLDKNKLNEQQTLKPPEEETQNLSDFEKHLQDLRSELKTTAKTNNKGNEKKNSIDILGVKLDQPRTETVFNRRDEQAAIEALKDEKPALADLLERDREAATKPPEYHDKELAERIASEKQKELKRKHLLFKLGAIRKELSNRIGSIDEKTHSVSRTKKSKSLTKSKSLGDEKIEEKKRQEVPVSEVQSSIRTQVQQEPVEQLKLLEGIQEIRQHFPNPDILKGRNHADSAPQKIKDIDQQFLSTQEIPGTKQAPPSKLEDVVSPVQKSAASVTPQQDTRNVRQDSRPFSPAGNTTTKPVTSPLHMTTKASSMHQPQMGINYNPLIKSPSPQVTSVTTISTSTSISTKVPSTSAVVTEATTITSSVVNTQNVSTTTTSTVTTSHTTGSKASSVISSSTMTKPVTHLPASTLSVSDGSLIQRRSKSPDAETHGALSLVKAIQSRLTGKSTGRKSPRPPDVLSKNVDIPDTKMAQDAIKDVKIDDEINKVPMPPDAILTDIKIDSRQKPVMSQTEVDTSVTVETKSTIKKNNIPDTKADAVDMKQDLSPKPAISPSPLSSVNSNLVYQGTVFNSTKDLLSHQLQQIAPSSNLGRMDSPDFKPMSEKLDQALDKHSHLDLYERKHALSSHKPVAKTPKAPEFGISYLKKAPTTEKINEDLGRFDEDGIYPQVMLIETPKTANPTPSPKAPRQPSSSQVIQPTLSSENVFQFPPPHEREHTKDFTQMAEDQNRQKKEDEMRRRELYRDDSFVRDSSPEYSPIPLPKDSVILRNKHQCLERRGSTSSESDVTVASQSSRSPRLSPRTMRKQAQAQKMRSVSNRGSTSSGIGGDLLNIPSASSAKDGFHMQSRNSKTSPRGSTTSLPQTSRHISGSRERLFTTPPGTPQNQFSKKSQTLPGGVLGRTSSADTVAISQRQDNTTVLASDSSTSSKRGDGRRRFRKRDAPVQSDPSTSASNVIQTQTESQNIVTNERKQHIHQDVHPIVPLKGQVEQNHRAMDNFDTHTESKGENTLKVSSFDEKSFESKNLPDSQATPVIILQAEPVIHELTYIPALTAEPIVQEIQYKPILSAFDASPAKDESQNTALSEANHFLLHRSADSSQVKYKDSKDQDSRQYHPRPALLKQSNVAEPKPAKVTAQCAKPLETTEEKVLSEEPSDEKSRNIVAKQKGEKGPPLTFDRDQVKLESDAELKSNRKELDSAIETLDALTKDLEERQQNPKEVKPTSEVGDKYNKAGKKPVTDVTAALSILRQNSLAEKQIGVDRGSRSIGFRPSPLQLSSVSSGSQVAKASESEILSPPVVITSKVVSESHDKEKTQSRPKSEERPVVMRRGGQGEISPSRPKSVVAGAGLIQRSKAQEKATTQTVGACFHAQPSKGSDISKQDNTLSKTIPGDIRRESETKEKLDFKSSGQNVQRGQTSSLQISDHKLTVKDKQEQKSPPGHPEPKRQQSSYLKKNIEEQVHKNQLEKQKLIEEKVQEEEHLNRQKEEIQKQQKEKNLKIKEKTQEKSEDQEKKEQHKVFKQQVEIPNFQKQEKEETGIQAKQRETQGKPDQEPQQQKGTLHGATVQDLKSKPLSTNVNYGQKIVDPVISTESEQMLMRKSQGAVQPSNAPGPQPAKSKQPHSDIQKHSVSKASDGKPVLAATGEKANAAAVKMQTVGHKQELISKQANQAQRPSQKQPSPPRKGQVTLGSGTAVKDARQTHLQKQNGPKKQASPQRQVQNASEKSQKMSEVAHTAKYQPGQPRQKKGPSPQRTTKTSTQRVQSSPQRQLPKVETVAAATQKGVAQTSKVVDKTSSAQSRRLQASPQRTSHVLQQKDAGKGSASPAQKKPGEKVQKTETQKPAAQRTVKKTVTTTTTYTNASGQKIQRQSSTTTTEEVTTNKDSEVTQKGQSEAKQKGPVQKTAGTRTPVIQMPGVNSTGPAQRSTSQKTVQDTKSVMGKDPQQQDVSSDTKTPLPVQKTQLQTGSAAQAKQSPNQLTSKKEDPASYTAETGAGKMMKKQSVTSSLDATAQRPPWKEKRSIEATSVTQTTGKGQIVQQEKDTKIQSNQAQIQQNSQKEHTAETISSGVRVQQKTPTATKTGKLQGQKTPSKGRSVIGTQQHGAQFGTFGLQFTVNKKPAVGDKKLETQTPVSPQKPILDQSMKSKFNENQEKQDSVLLKMSPAQQSSGTPKETPGAHPEVKTTEDNKIALSPVQTDPILIETSSVLSVNKAKVPHETHFPATDIEQNDPHDQGQWEKGSEGVQEGKGKAPPDGSDTIVGVALSRLQRHNDGTTKEQLTSKKYDIQSGHRDVSSLSRKFGGSVELCSPESTQVKKAVSPQPPISQPQRADLQQSQPQITQASEPKAMQQSKPQTTEASESIAMQQSQPQITQVSEPIAMQQCKPQAIQASKPIGMQQSKPQAIQALAPIAMEQSKPQVTQASTAISAQRSKPQITQASASLSMQQSKPQVTQTTATVAAQKSKPHVPQSSGSTVMPQSQPQARQTSETIATQQCNSQMTEGSVPAKTRRTPERTMSLREEKRSTPERERVLTKAYSSFRDGDVKRRKPRLEKSENLVDEELQKILNRRSNYLEDWEQQVLSSEGETSADKSVAQFEARLRKEKQSKQDAVIVDRELSQMLEHRRANTDSESDSPTKPSLPSEPSVDTVAKQQAATPTPTAATVTSTLKQTSSFEMEISEKPTPVPSILKKKSEEEPITKPTPSILKKDSQVKNQKNTCPQQDIRPILKKEPSFEKQPQSVVKTSLHVTPEVKQVAKQEAVPVQKTMRHFKLQKSKTLGEMPSEASEKVDFKQNNKRVEEIRVKSSARPILRKAKTFDSSVEEMDPELASLLKSRRRSSDESDEKKPDKPVAAAVEGSGDQSVENEESRLSVAERIFQMQSKIEESSLPVSRTGSALIGTPKNKSSSKSMPTSPGLLGNRTVGGSPVLSLKTSEDDLLTKLTDVAAAEKSATDRRNRFQRSRDNWRRRTQPITEEEVKSADALESVNSFRAEILRHTSLSFFKQQAEQKDSSKSLAPVKKVKGQETFPQPMKRDRFKDRRKNNLGRFKSLPELNQISETELLMSKETLTKKWSSDIDKNKVSKNKLGEDSDARAMDIVPADIVKEKANIFQQPTVPEIQIESKVKSSQAVSCSSTEVRGVGTVSTAGTKGTVIREDINSKSLQKGSQNMPQNLTCQKQTGTSLTTKALSSQSIVTSSLSSGTHPEEGMLSSDDDFDKLVEINARTLMEDSSSSVSERDSFRVTKQDLSSMTMSLKPPDPDIAINQPSSPEDEMSKMSLSEKLSKFKHLDQKAQGGQELAASKSPSSPRRLMSRKERMERSQTQPITVQELSSASTFAKNQMADEVIAKVKDTVDLKVKDRDDFRVKDSVDSEVDTTASEDDLSKLSLAEKMKLFSSPSTSPQIVEDSTTPPTRKYSPPRRKGKKFQSRFKTQPVTTTEVQKASRISPLAMSLVKPPDPETMKGLSVKEQRELTALHAEMTLSGQASSSSNPALSIADNAGANEEVNRHEGILKTPPDIEKETKGILKSSSHQSTVNPSESISPDSSRKGILKHTTHEEAAVPKGILKSGHSSGLVDESETSTVIHQQSQSCTQGIKGILKTESPKLETDERLHGILKTGHLEKQEIRSILKPSVVGGGEEGLSMVSQEIVQKSTCDIDTDAIEDTKDEDQRRDHRPDKVNSALKNSANQDLTSGSSEYQTASEPEVLNSAVVSSKHPELSAGVTMDKDRLEGLDIQTVQEPVTDANATTSKVLSKTVVSKTSLRLSSSDTSDIEDLHSLKVVSGQQRSPVTRSKDDLLVFEEQDNNKEQSCVESKDVSTSSTKAKSDSVVKTINSEVEVVTVENKSVLRDDLTKETQSALPNPTSQYDSSTDEELVHRRIKNEAVARRRLNRELHKSGDRYHTQPVDGTQDEKISPGKDAADQTSEVELRRAKRIASRHHTQPITPTEKEAVESFADINQPSKMSGSIADRLSSLQQRGEHEWKKRVQRDSPSPSGSSSSSPSRLRDRQSQLMDKLGEVKMRDKADVLRSQERPVSLAERMSCLEDAQAGWRKRVEDKDTSKFTVEGKMSGKVAASPLVDKRHTRANLNRELDSVLSNGLATPSRKRMTVPPDVVLPSTPQTKQYKETEAASTPNIPVSTKIVAESVATDSDENKENSVVEVPRADDESFQSFYSQSETGGAIKRHAVDVSLEDMDTVTSNQVLSQTKRARPQNRQTRASKNPLKALAQRDDLKSQYEEYNTGVAEKELRRIKTDQIAGKACMATDALAALATKESFDKVKLRKAETVAGGSYLSGGDRFVPYKDLMLIQVKGRRSCQCRLVAPVAHSINSGDCFILVTPNKVYVWIGEFCNVIEKSKAFDVAQTIQQKKDLGCKSSSDPCVIQEGKDFVSSGEEFWSLLGGRGKPQAPGPAEEDELYEMYLAETNMVYKVQGEHLVAQKEQWGQVLRHEILTDKEVLVFDFGSEVYVWTGKHVDISERRVANKLATEIWCCGYDYTNCDINPLSPLQTEESGGLPLKSHTRPDWALLGKVNRNMETILFKEKFIDWPDSSSKVIKMKESEQDLKYEFVELKACDVEEMRSPDSHPVDLVLEGSHIGRGDKWVETEDGIRREFEVVTIDIAVWHVLQFDHFQLEEHSYGQFHDGDTFVIRWHYKITQSGIKTLKGKEAAHSQTGREKCAYFFWQGKNSSITEKGASALMTVELDQERGPQVRVVQGKEPPCFVRLFGSKMVVHIGKREEEETNTQGDWKLYLVRNELEKEAYLLEVPPCIQNLRSRSSSILLNVGDGQMFIWHGAKSIQDTKARALECAKIIEKRAALEFGIREKAICSVTEVEEGSETARFRRALGGSAAWRAEHKPFHSLLKDKNPVSTPRLFHTSSVSGQFVAKEIQNLTRCDNIVSAFPFIQSDLYKAAQPALFLLDAGHVVYLWQGWWPEETEEDENVRTGSAESRLDSEKKVGMETCLDYCKAKKSGGRCPSYLVFAGLEPLEFTNLFPTWEVQDDIRNSQILEGRTDGEKIEISAYLHKLTQTRYTYAELQERPLPEGVDPLRMEKYLHDDEFETVLETSKEEFYSMPPWKQINLKKDKGLF